MKIDLSKIPILKEFSQLDMSNAQTRKSVIMALAAIAGVVILLIVSIPRPSKSSSVSADAKTQKNSAPPIQDGEDLDNVGARSIIDLRTRKSDNGAFARRMFDEGEGGVESILTKKGKDGDSTGTPAIQPGTAPSGYDQIDYSNPEAVIAAATAEAEAEMSQKFGGGKSADDNKNTSPTNSAGTAKAQNASSSSSNVVAQQTSSSSGTTTKKTSSGKSGGRTSRPKDLNEAAEQRRERIREMGIDPDTGLPIMEESVSGSTTESEPSEHPSAPQPPEGVEKAEVSVRGRGSMSSFGSSSSQSESGFASFGSREQQAVSTGAKFFKVAFAYDEKVKSGQRVTLRLKEKITVGGFELPVNSIIYATCSTKEERLLLKVRNIDINGKAYFLNYDAVDVDWEEGLYCPSNASGKKIKEAAKEVGQIVTSAASSIMGSIPSRLLSSGTSMVQSSSGVVTVSVTEGYEFFLVPAAKQ